MCRRRGRVVRTLGRGFESRQRQGVVSLSMQDTLKSTTRGNHNQNCLRQPEKYKIWLAYNNCLEENDR
jgi:hypothetical protein